MSNIFAHTAYSDFCSQNITLALVWVSETFFSLTWHCDRRIRPPSILLGTETESFSLFHLSFDLLGTESEGCLSFLLPSLLPSFFLLEGEEGGEEKEEVEATEVNRQKKRGEMTA